MLSTMQSQCHAEGQSNQGARVSQALIFECGRSKVPETVDFNTTAQTSLCSDICAAAVPGVAQIVE